MSHETQGIAQSHLRCNGYLRPNRSIHWQTCGNEGCSDVDSRPEFQSEEISYIKLVQVRARPDFGDLRDILPG
jgi:hypothetical protein